MRTVLLTTDSREHFGDYSNPNPYFGAAPEALLQGFAQLPEVEKAKVADYVIDNSGSLDHTREQAQNVWEKLRTEAMTRH